MKDPAILNIDPPDADLAYRHASALGYEPISSYDIDVRALVKLASARGISYGEAMQELRRYKGAVRSWSIPLELVGNVVDRHPDEIATSYFTESFGMVDSGLNWALRAIRMAAVNGSSLCDIAERVVLVLEACGQDSGLLVALAAAIPSEVTFDHLLILGCLQLASVPEESAAIAAMCRPFAIQPDGVEEKAAVLLRLGSWRLDEEGFRKAGGAARTTWV
jgi:hypothetical protein